MPCANMHGALIIKDVVAFISVRLHVHFQQVVQNPNGEQQRLLDRKSAYRSHAQVHR